MKKYIVFYTNRVESNDIESFDTLAEAKNYCDEQGQRIGVQREENNILSLNLEIE